MPPPAEIRPFRLRARYRRLIWLGGILACAILLVLFFANIVVIIIGASILALVLRPLMDRLQRIRIGRFNIPKSICAIVSVSVFFLVLTGLLLFLMPTVLDEVEGLARIDFEALSENFSDESTHIQEIADRYGIAYNPDTLRHSFMQMREEMLPRPSQMVVYVSGWLTELGNFLVTLFSMMFIAFFLLMDRKLIPMLLIILTPNTYNRPMIRIYHRVEIMLRRYFTALIIQVAYFGLLILIGSYVLGLPNPFFLAALGAIFNLVPYIGSFIAFGVGALVTGVSLLETDPDGLLMGLVKLAGVMLGTQFLDNAILSNFLFANSVKAHPLEIFLVVLLASQIAGVVGMVVAVPVYTVLRIVLLETLPKNAAVERLTREMRESLEDDNSDDKPEPANT